MTMRFVVLNFIDSAVQITLNISGVDNNRTGLLLTRRLRQRRSDQNPPESAVGPHQLLKQGFWSTFSPIAKFKPTNPFLFVVPGALAL